jgi:hypothetical protein
MPFKDEHDFKMEGMRGMLERAQVQLGLIEKERDALVGQVESLKLQIDQPGLNSYLLGRLQGMIHTLKAARKRLSKEVCGMYEVARDLNITALQNDIDIFVQSSLQRQQEEQMQQQQRQTRFKQQQREQQREQQQQQQHEQLQQLEPESELDKLLLLHREGTEQQEGQLQRLHSPEQQRQQQQQEQQQHQQQEQQHGLHDLGHTSLTLSKGQRGGWKSICMPMA